MANQDFYYPTPPISVSATNPSVGVNGATAPASSTEIGYIVAGNLVGANGTANGLQVDGSAVTQPVSAVALPLPTGAATAAKQPALGTAGTPSADVISVQGESGMTPLKVDGSAVTQPISAAALPLPAGAATSALQTSGNASLSTIATNTPALGQALAAASSPVVLPAAQVTALTPPTTVTVTQATATNLNATVVQPTAANLNVTAAPLTNSSVVKAQLQDNAGTGLSSTSNALNVSVQNASLPVSSGGTDAANAPVYNAYSTTSVTTSAYLQLVASMTSTANSVYIFDSSGQAMILATGGAGSEVIKMYVPPGGGNFPLQIASGTRVALKALTANATSGYFLMGFLK